MDRHDAARDVLRDETWLPTPLLQAHTAGARLGVELWLKREDCTPVGSFKLRGALVTMAGRAHEVSDPGVWAASAGNYGLAIAMAGRRHRVKVTVVVPEGATPSKVERIRLCGADVVHHGTDFDAAKEFARTTAGDLGAAFWEDGVVEEMAHGAATIADELLDHPEPWDYVLVPIGNGSLMKGISGVFKARSPTTTVVGLVPAGTPSMADAIRGRTWGEHAATGTIADGLAVRVPIPDIVEDLKPLVDELWLVDESKLLPAVRSLMELEQVMVEPSAAITLAGLADRRAELSGKRVAAIVTGAHLDMSLVPELARLQGLV